ncbi:MAG: hypothetical protein MK101_01435 [Phycisphaerales bacterium]|nr:hypothetical protein [Phycisphaerales bacterium]
MSSMSTAVAWCALLIAALVLLGPGDNLQVQAGAVASADGFTLLTGQSRDPRASGGQELVYVVDHRSGMLLVYGLQPGEGNVLMPVLLDGGPVASLFGHPQSAHTAPGPPQG